MIINPYLVQPSGPAYGTLTTAWIAATGETDLTIIGALNTLESDLTTYGLTSKMKALYPFVGATAGKHSYNFMNTAAYQLTFNGGWTHSSTGALPNGTNAYADTAFNVNTYKDNNHLSYYIRTNLDEVRVDAGLIGNIGQYFDIESRISNVGYFGNHISGVNINFAVTDSRGLWLNTRTTSTLQKVYKNGTSQGSNTASGTTAINGNIYLGARNLVGTGANLYSTKQTAFASIGDGLTDTEAANFYTAVQTFQTTLGRQVGTPIPFAMPLDTYSGAAVAYSAARRLSSTYTGSLIRVRRSSDNAEQNIGYDTNNVLDEAALTAFVGAGDGFVTTIYDQSGNVRNATQATASNQPRIVLSGVIETVNSKPSINYLSNMWITNAASINTKSVFTVSKVAAFVNLQSLFTFASTTGPWVRSYDPNYYKSRTSSPMNLDDYTNGNDMYFNNHLHLNTDNFTNSHILSSFGDKTATFQLSTQYYGRQYNGKITEAILYGTDENAGYRTGINANMNTFYSIY